MVSVRLLTAILLTAFSAQAATFYISKEAAGSNAGTSLANAWTNVTVINWSLPVAGDTIEIDGGPAGTTNVYYGSMSDQSGSPNYGTKANPITIKAMQDAGHNGLVKIAGGIFISRDYWVVDGSKTDWAPGSVLDTYRVGTNCNIEVWQTNATSAVIMYGTGSKLKSVHVSQMTSYDDSAISMLDNGISHPIGDGSEIAYCWISEANGYGIRCEIAYFYAQTYGQIAVHHNLIEGMHDNFIQIGGYCDIYKNVCRDQHYPTAGHPDCIQEVIAWVRCYDNIFSDNQGSGFYIEANFAVTHDILYYNNILYWTTNQLQDAVGITGHDAQAGQDCVLSNMWFFGNTIYGLKGFSWNRGNSISGVSGRPNGSVTNFWWMNNCIIGLGSPNSPLQFPTNRAVWNGYLGFDYLAADVRVDYNSLNGFTGSGNGIIYGAHGAFDLSNQYTNMAQFASDTPYKSNNNSTASFLSLTNYDFRPAAGDAALAGRGTNLTALLSALAPECTNDILGVPRGATWDIGAYQHPSGYWVSIAGSDSANGSFTAPWRTIGHATTMVVAGDTVNIGPGDYQEDVSLQYAVGTLGSPIRFVAYPPQQAALHSFQLQTPYIVLDSLVFSNYAGPPGSYFIATPVLAGANNCVITNCIYTHIPTAIASDFHFATNGGNQIISASSDFQSAGFSLGSSVYLGACGLPGQYYTNHDETWIVSRVDQHTLWVTNGAATLFTNDTGSGYWAAIAVSGGPNLGVCALGTDPITNLAFCGNTIRDWFGPSLRIKGSGHLISGNLFTNIISYCWLDWLGNNTVICSNVFRHNPTVLYFGGNESSLLTHPAGAGWYDFFMSQINSENSSYYPENTNNTFAWNYVEGIDNELGSVYGNGYTNTHGFAVTNNVFVGTLSYFSLARNAALWANNVLYRNAVESDSALILGSESGAPQTGVVVTNNLFIDCCKKLNGDVGYSIWSGGQITNQVINRNMTAGPETMGYPSSTGFTETNGVNGGDPVFYNPSAGTPPGFLVLPNSPMAAKGGGYGVYQITTNVPVAHFRLLSPAAWVEATGTNYDPAWMAATPGTRYHLIRPWNTAPMIGTNVTAVFDATFSISATNGVTTNLGISQYVWTIDGASTTNSTALKTNTFSDGGTKAVVLTVYNTAGNTASTTNYYGLGGAPASTNAPAAPGRPTRLSVLL